MNSQVYSGMVLLYVAMPAIIIVLMGLIVALLFRLSVRLNRCIALLDELGTEIRYLQVEPDVTVTTELEGFDAD